MIAWSPVFTRCLLLALSVAFSTLNAQRTVAAKPRVAAVRTPAGPRCSPANGENATTALARAATIMGLADVGARVRVSPITDVTSLDYQSDRPYPPYLWTSREQRLVVAAQGGRVRLDFSPTGTGPAIVNDGARAAVVSPRGAQLVPLRSTNFSDERALDPWLVIVDWQRANDVRVTGVCGYREVPRLVLTRATGSGEERLFLDPTTGYPVKLERREPHYLWGDVLAEYTWAIWTPIPGARALAPSYAFRLVDGDVNVQRLHGSFRLWAADSAALTQIPEKAAPAADRPLQPDTVRVNEHTWLLRTASYTNVVTLQRDTVFVLDAPVDADRALRDSAWIGRLFPGRHPVVLVVTDLAWPHIAGVRYWVAMGATVVSRTTNRPLLDRVVQRRWTLTPDALERRGGPRGLPFRAVRDSLSFAGGAVRLLPIDGIGSEGALMVFLPGERFLWAGDFMQPGGPDSFSRVYADEVSTAVTRAGITPAKVAAMHFPLTDWTSRPQR